MVSLMVTTITLGAVTIITDTKVRNAKPRDAQYKLTDDRGLCLLVAPNGGKWWRFNYRFDGKQKTLSMGVYPEVTLADARARRDAARRLIAAGTDPSDHRKATKATQGQITENTFEAVAREWFEKFKPRWAATHSSKIIRRLEVDLFPWLGRRPIAEISPPEVLKCVHRVEGRGAKDTAHRALQNAGQVFRYAVATGRMASDPTRDLRGAIAPATHKHYAAITEPAAVGELLRAIDGFKGTFVVQCALRLAPLFFVRPGELRRARWEEMDLAKGEWRQGAPRNDAEVGGCQVSVSVRPALRRSARELQGTRDTTPETCAVNPPLLVATAAPVLGTDGASCWKRCIGLSCCPGLAGAPQGREVDAACRRQVGEQTALHGLRI
jgi:hypothetical protein